MDLGKKSVYNEAPRYVQHYLEKQKEANIAKKAREEQRRLEEERKKEELRAA